MWFSDLIDAYIRGRQYAVAARCYFDWEEDGRVRFKGGTHEYTLTYSLDAEKWQCDCVMYKVFGTCAHTKAAKESLPVPVPVVVQ
jgi:hypothetical protein